MKVKSFFTVFLMLLFCVLLPFTTSSTTYAKESIQDSKAFLTWYEANKNQDYAEYKLSGNLYLDQGTKDQPIMLDGNGQSVYIDCNGYSVYIRSHVIMDNKGLFFLTSWKDASPILIVDNKDKSQSASLTLKNGGASGNQIALQVLSGEVNCPDGENRFTLNGSQTAIDIQTSDITLRNLDINAESEANILAVKAKTNLTIINSTITAKKLDTTQPANDVIAVEAGDTIKIENSQITAQGQGAKSVVSKAGNNQIQVDKDSTLNPILEVTTSSQATYEVTKIETFETINVPINTSPSQVLLPTTIKCTITSKDKTNKQVAIPTTWDTTALHTSLQSNGEYTIQGTLSQAFLDENSIYVATSYQPTYKIQVVPLKTMDYIRYTDIVNEKESSTMQVMLYRPYLATTLHVQYSDDGITWSNGYCLNKDNQKDENFLNCGNNQENKILATAHFPALYQGGYIRNVVQGGLFEGTWQAIPLSDEFLFTPPGQDGGGGNRGGGGQQTSDRDVNDKEETKEETSEQITTALTPPPTQDAPLLESQKKPTNQDEEMQETPVLTNTASQKDNNPFVNPMMITILVLPILAGITYQIWKRKQKQE